MRTSLYRALAVLGILLTTATNASAQELQAADTAKVRFLNNRKFYIYKVTKGETLYGISKKFGIPQDEIEELNPSINKEGFKPRMDLWIPAYSWKNKDTGKKNLSNDVVKEEVKKGDAKLSIVVLSPIDLSKVYTGPADSTDSVFYEPINRSTLNNLEFVEGALLSAEDHEGEGRPVQIKVTVVDTESDTVHLEKIGWRFRQNDVWITNETGQVLDYLVRQADKYGAQLVSCGINTTDNIRRYGQSIAMLPSSLSQCELMGSHMTELAPRSKGIFVKTSNNREQERMKAFRKGWEAADGNASSVVDYTKGNTAAVIDSLKKGRMNIIFLPSSNEDLVTTLLIALREKISDFEFKVVGLPTWYGFETIDPSLLQACNVHFFNAGSITDQTLSGRPAFKKQFHERYASDPGESAYIGYDAADLVIKTRTRHGKNFFESKTSHSFQGIFTDYRFQRPSAGSCLENRHIQVWTFKEFMPFMIAH